LVLRESDPAQVLLLQSKNINFINPRLWFGYLTHDGLFVDIKRAESMKVEKKANPARRVPSFTTRRRTQSFRRPGGVDSPGPGPENLPPVEIRGILDRKHELMSGGKRAAIRSWKSYYTGKITSLFLVLLVVSFFDYTFFYEAII
jgi:hypothetical protein